MISEENEKKINKLKDKNWEVCIIWTSSNYNYHSEYKEGEFHWEVDFTRRMKNGLWDNHQATLTQLARVLG